MPSRKRAFSSSLSAAPSSDEDVKPSPARTPKKQAKGSSTPRSSAKSARSSAKPKKEETDAGKDQATAHDEPITPHTPKRARKKPTSAKKELADGEEDDEEKPKPTPSPSKSTLAKKLKQLEAYLQTPFPEHLPPTSEQCQQVQDALARIHGLPKRPEKLVDREGAAAGCGAVPDVLDALIRTILSQNTTSKSKAVPTSKRHG